MHHKYTKLVARRKKAGGRGERFYFVISNERVKMKDHLYYKSSVSWTASGSKVYFVVVAAVESTGKAKQN